MFYCNYFNAFALTEVQSPGAQELGIENQQIKDYIRTVNIVGKKRWYFTFI